jgi:hypothetical protein
MSKADFMTPHEMYADARRKGFTLADMLHYGAINLAKMESDSAFSAEAISAQREAFAWLKALAKDEPEDQRATDIGILDWRFQGQISLLVTLTGEIVAKIRPGRAAGGYWWSVFNPPVKDISNIAKQDCFLRDGPFRSRPSAAKALLRVLDRRSVELLGVDSLFIPPFRLPNRR